MLIRTLLVTFSLISIFARAEMAGNGGIYGYFFSPPPRNCLPSTCPVDDNGDPELTYDEVCNSPGANPYDEFAWMFSICIDPTDNSIYSYCTPRPCKGGKPTPPGVFTGTPKTPPTPSTGTIYTIISPNAAGALAQQIAKVACGSSNSLTCQDVASKLCASKAPTPSVLDLCLKVTNTMCLTCTAGAKF